MTQIPEAGSKWIRGGETATVIFADDRSVLLEDDDGSRWHFTTDIFAILYQPEPRKVTHRRWVNLYADGRLGDYFETEEAAREIADEMVGEGYFETRLIEWTVEE